MNKFYIAAVLSVALYATLPSIIKHIGENIPSFTFIAISSTTLGLVSLLFACVFERGQWPNLSSVQSGAFNWLGLYILLNLMGYLCYIHAARNINVVHFELIGVLSPVVAAIVGYFLLRENIRTEQFVGLLIMGFGLYVGTRHSS